MVGEWGGPPTRLWLFSQKKMEWRQRKRERERARGDDDCFPLLAGLILPTEEIVRLSRSADRSLRSGKMASTIRSLSLHLAIPFSLFSPSLFFLSVRLSFGFYYVFSDNCFSLQIILEVKSFANEQIVIKSYKFLHYRPSKMEPRAQFMAHDKSEIRVGVLQVEGWGCLSSWWWCSPGAQRQRLIIHALRSEQ